MSVNRSGSPRQLHAGASVARLTTFILPAILLCTASSVCGQLGRPSPPSGSFQPQSWRLGVRIRNLTTGVELTNVVGGSPAAAAGLSGGDTIVTVAGQQVGFVDGRLIDVGDEVQRSMRRGGRVNLLVQKRRGLQLENLAISPTSTRGNLAGTAVYLETASSVSRRATLIVRLRDRTFAHWSGAIVAESTVTRADRQQIPFELTYDPSQIFADHNYWVEAEVRDRGQLTHQGAAPWGKVPGIVTLSPVATTLQTGTMSAALVEPRIRQWYLQYLGRSPTTQERAAWQNHIARGQSVEDVQAYLLASNEYLDRHQQDADQYWQSVYRSLRGVPPSTAELSRLRQEHAESNGVRSRVIRQLMREN